ncbi:MAG: hypothetical protein R3E95_16840 [Thiolinea sp.]
MNLNELTTLEAIDAFLSGTQPVAFSIQSNKADRYRWLETTLVRWRYHQRPRGDKGRLLLFMERVSGYSRPQLNRLIAQHRQTGHIHWHPARKNGFKRRYTDADIRRLAQLDKLHDSPSGAVIKKLCERAFQIFGQSEYGALATISVAQIYRFRQSKTYQRQHLQHQKTQATQVNIGERKKPVSQGEPGYLRIDTVHQGDLDKEKGVYHINAVDEVTQFEVVTSVVAISERFLLPVLEQLLRFFPFEIKGFHSDNGSEYINYPVAELLAKLHIEFTKSRSRHSNDNALAEGKNAAIVRKTYGHAHIPKHWAKAINEINHQELYRYTNFHRPCYFPETVTNEKGQQRKRYPYSAMMTPFEKLKSLCTEDNVYLKTGVTMEQLDAFSREMDDTQAVTQLREAQQRLFKNINEQMKKQA